MEVSPWGELNLVGISALAYQIYTNKKELKENISSRTVTLSNDMKSGRGRINVFCGPNNSGKSYLIQSMYNLLKKSNHVYNVSDKNGEIWRSDGYYGIKVDASRAVRSFKANIFSQKNQFGFISNSTINEKFKPSNHSQDGFVYLIFEILHKTVKREQFYSDNLNTSADKLHRFWNSKQFRQKLLDELKFDIPKYRQRDPKNKGIFWFLEQYTSSPVGVCRTEKGFTLCYQDQGIDVKFEDWSDGVKALACLESMLAVRNVDVLFIDELENHLHPMLISEAMSIIKKSGVQAIITTHHPHIVFSRLVDKVFYIEKIRSTVDEISERSISISELRTNFEKIFNTYNLFSHKDDVLLKQSRHIRHTADIKFYAEFMRSFGYDVVSPSSGWLPDSQSDFLSQVLEDFKEQDTVNVLDIGAGLGRTFSEISKTRITSSGRDFNWYMWEPNIKHRDTLSNSLIQFEDRHVSVLKSLDEIQKNTYDFSLLINVAHELPSKQFSEVLILALNALKENGAIIIGELYPLLHAEKCAVPYNSETLSQILYDFGLRTYVRPFTFFSGAGYYLVGRKNTETLDLDLKTVHRSVVEGWRRIKKSMLRDYLSNPGETGDISIFRQTVQTMHTIASIDADFEGIWK